MGDELYYLDEHGGKRDAKLHEELLDNQAADLFCRKQSFKRAIASGTPDAVARQLYGADADEQ
ncbi:MAG: hypothetical protein ABL962_08240 [Fimbriimonadaceae bacterium]